MGHSAKILSSKSLIAVSLLTLFSCSLPFFGKGRIASSDPGVQKLSKLSGILEFREGCAAGYYKIVLKGLFEAAGTEVEAQSDSLGRFNVTAPPGRYLAQVARENCGSQDTIVLEKNTEHMYSFVVQETRAIEKVGQEEPSFPSRLPASVLIIPGK